MGVPRINTGSNGALSSAEQIKLIAKDFQCGSGKRTAHLVNISLATLKWLMLNAESDDIRFRAAEALLGLAPARQKLDMMSAIVASPDLGREARPAVLARRLKAAMAGSPEQAARILKMVEAAESPANPNKTNGNP